MSTLIVNELDAARESDYRIRMPSGAHLNIQGTLAVDNSAGSQAQIIFPKGNSAQRPANPTAGMVRINTNFYGARQVEVLEGYDGTEWTALVESAEIEGETVVNPNAQGGTILLAGGYKYHIFKTVGSTDFTFISPATGVNVEYLVVGGGGGGGGGDVGAGGGAGGFRTNKTGAQSGGGCAAEASMVVTAGTYPVVVGAGGNGGSSSGSNASDGGDSSWNGIVSEGGGGGPGWSASNGRPGGSGSGSTGQGGNNPGTGTNCQGFAGGTGLGGSNYPQGGGGGAGAVGESAPNQNQAGAGGAGLPNPFQDSNIGQSSGGQRYLAGGGGGGVESNATVGNGGVGGGGIGGRQSPNLDPGNGLPNTGGGGGGEDNQTGGSGGSGVVILRYAFVDDGTSVPAIAGASEDNPAVSAKQAAADGFTGDKIWMTIGSTAYEMDFDPTDRYGSGDTGWVKFDNTVFGANNSTIDYTVYGSPSSIIPAFNNSSVDSTSNSTISSGTHRIGRNQSHNGGNSLSTIRIMLPKLTRVRYNASYVSGGNDTADFGSFNQNYSGIINNNPYENNGSGYWAVIWDGDSSGNFSNSMLIIDPGNLTSGNQSHSQTILSGSFSGETTTDPYIIWGTTDAYREYRYTNSWELWIH
tara:strand:+ start:6056 stop:7966 length:1911 start_codon:yes stop_codon:yes gene_type:complete